MFIERKTQVKININGWRRHVCLQVLMILQEKNAKKDSMNVLLPVFTFGNQEYYLRICLDKNSTAG